MNPFDAEAARYDAWFDSPRGTILFANELAALQLLWGAGFHPAVEIGVGTGRFAQALGIEQGVDPAAGALRLAGARGIRTTLARGESLPFGDGTFQGAALITSLSFAADPVAVLGEIARILCPGGHVLVGEIPRDSIWGRRCQRKKDDGDPFFAGMRSLIAGEIVALLAGAGFKPVAFASTLIESTPDFPRTESPRPGLIDHAGFVGILGSKNA